METVRKYIFKSKYLLLALACLSPMLYELSGMKFRDHFKNSSLSHFIFLVFILIFGAAVWYILIFDEKKGITERDIVFWVIWLGFALRFSYVLGTDYPYRQHDVNDQNGHLDYIKYLLNEKHLPDFDVTKKWQFYHPPLWHTLCALWVKFSNFLGLTGDSAYESLQCLSLYFSSAIMLASFKLFKLFKLKLSSLFIALSVVAVHPTFIILSGSINNDISSIFFALLSIVLSIKWYREPNFKNIIKLALSIGFSMMFKLSGGMVAFGIGLLFLIKFFSKETKEAKKRGNIFAQFAAFGAICVPLALWWEIRNLIKFGTPPTYVPGLTDKNPQYIGFRSNFARFFNFSSLYDNGVYPARATKNLVKAYGFKYYEYNIPLAATKSSVFGEYYIGANSQIGVIFANILFYGAALMALLAVFSGIYMLIKAFKNKNKREGDEYISTFVYCVVSIISYISFCFQYPHFCTMDFRYIALLVVFGSMYIALFTEKLKENNNICGKVLSYTMCGTVILFGVASTYIYALLI